MYIYGGICINTSEKIYDKLFICNLGQSNRKVLLQVLETLTAQKKDYGGIVIYQLFLEMQHSKKDV